jgi:hypothetical protein
MTVAQALRIPQSATAPPARGRCLVASTPVYEGPRRRHDALDQLVAESLELGDILADLPQRGRSRSIRHADRRETPAVSAHQHAVGPS